MSQQDKQAELAWKLKCNMAQHIKDAHKVVVPPGTLGAGLAINETNDVHESHDEDSITITGTVVLRVFRPKD